jgi:hypothetical protein
MADDLVQVAARVSPDVPDRLEAIAAALPRMPGNPKPLTRSDALRAVIDRGLPAMETELNIGPKGGKKPARKG